MAISILGVLIFVPLFLQVVDGASPTRSGLLLIPLMLGMMHVRATCYNRVCSQSIADPTKEFPCPTN